MSRRLRSIGIFGVIALVALFALLPVAGAAPRGADTITVDIPAIEFKPKEVTVKVGTLNGETLQAAPEFESCKKLSAQTGAPLKQIYQAAAKASKN